MDRFARVTAFGLLLAAAALHVGCSGASGFLTGSTTAADAPGKLNNEDPAARPVAVAWTSARAVRCGFYFDPAKLKASYLAYEAKQAGPDKLANVEKTYDSTFKAIRDRVSSDPDYCTNRKSAEIKTDLTRHLAGDFKPNLPKPQVAVSCGLFGCGDGSGDKPWSADQFWKDEAARQTGR